MRRTDVLRLFLILHWMFVSYDATVLDGSAELSPGVFLKGELEQNDGLESDEKQFTFFGIKYGRAERWKSSTLNSNYKYKSEPSFRAKGYCCYQYLPSIPSFQVDHSNSSEDCLYLDVYLPPLKATTDFSTQKLPVLLWIHGGALISGCKDEYPAAELARALNSIVVTISYRMGPFGFLSTKDSIVPGNLGLEDPKIALEWVRRNIAAFQGDPERIVLSGESAGALILSAMLLDNKVREKVYAAIVMSGSVVAPYDIRNEGFSSVAKLAQLTGCPDTTSREAIKCLKTRPAAEIAVTANDPYFMTPSALAGQKWSFVVDGVHIPIDAAEYLKTLRKTPLRGGFVTGYLAEDASVLMDERYWTNMMGTSQPTLQWIKDFVIPDFLQSYLNCVKDDPLKGMIEEVFNFFHFDERDAEERRRQVIRFMNLFFSAPALLEAQIYSENQLATRGTQLFEITYVTDKPIGLGVPFISVPAVWKYLGAYHFMDVMYLFGKSIENTHPQPFGLNVTYEDATWQMRVLFNQVLQNGAASGESFSVDEGRHLVLDKHGKWRMTQTAGLREKLDFMERLKNWQCGKSNPDTGSEAQDH